MRGDDNRTGELFSYVDLEARVRRDHPLRAMRAIVNEALSALEREFAALYAVSQRVRKRLEEAFGWIKTVARQDKTKFRGRDRVGWAFTFAAAAYNLVRLPKLMAAPE